MTILIPIYRIKDHLNKLSKITPSVSVYIGNHVVELLSIAEDVPIGNRAWFDVTDDDLLSCTCYHFCIF
jgi:hypothetical protein